MTALKNIAFLGLVIFLAGWIIGQYMVVTAREFIRSDARAVTPVEWIVVPGASVYRSGRLSPALRYRMDMALLLHKAQPNAHLLFSGHDIPGGYSETRAMRDYALDRGVSDSLIRLDSQGKSTFITLFNCKKQFAPQSLALVSQQWHLPRALYIARKLDMDAQGLVVPVASEQKPHLREWSGRLKDFMLVRIFKYFHAAPPF